MAGKRRCSRVVARVWWLGTAVLAGCGGTDGRYVGQAVPETASALCREGRASLQVRGGRALFILNEGAQALEGNIAEDGTVRAARETRGSPPFVQVFEGRVAEGRATGVYGSPRCRARVELGRG